MKKLIATILALALVLSSIGVFAAETELENAVKLVKSVFDIPENATRFASDSYTDSDGSVYYYMYWNNDDYSDDYVWVNASVRNNKIESFGISQDESDLVKLPVYSKEEVLSAAKDILKKALGSDSSKIDFENPYNERYENGAYSFEFRHKEYGIEVEYSSCYVTIDATNLSVKNFSRYFQDSYAFPGPDNIISEERARELLSQNGAVTLLYKTFADKKDRSLKLVYALNPSIKIDAHSEDVAAKEDYYYLMGRGDVVQETVSAKNMALDTIILTPEEQEEILNYQNFIPQEEFEKKLRNDPLFNIDSQYEVTYFGYTTRTPFYTDEQKRYIASIEFSKEKNDCYQSVSARFDAMTGQLLSYNKGGDEFSAKAKSESTLKSTSEKVAKKYFNSYLNECFDANSTAYEYGLTTVYQRKIGDIPFPEDNLSIYVDKSGEILSINLTWLQDLVPDAVSPALDLVDAENKFSENNEISLKYTSNYDEGKMHLVYGYAWDGPLYISAKDGTLLSENGEEFTKTENFKSYTDIDNHYAKDIIEKMAEIGIYYDSPEFLPDAKISQIEFLTFLVKSQLSYYSDYRDESLYEYLIKQKIVLPEEKNPDVTIAKQDAIKFLMRAKGLEKVAKLDIFKLDFLDANEVLPTHFGYLSIAKGMEIVSGDGGYLRPCNEITRAEAMIILYNAIGK